MVIFLLAYGCEVNISKTGNAFGNWNVMNLDNIKQWIGGQAETTPSVTVTRTLPDNCNGVVTLNIGSDTLSADEVFIIADRVPEGATVDSWSETPLIIDGRNIVWLFATNPPKKFGSQSANAQIPSLITYTISGTSTTEFIGKWGLGDAKEDGIILGNNICD